MSAMRTVKPCTKPMPAPSHQVTHCQLSKAPAYRNANNQPIVTWSRKPIAGARLRSGVTMAPSMNGMLIRDSPNP